MIIPGAYKEHITEEEEDDSVDSAAPALLEISAACIDPDKLKVHIPPPFRLAAGHADTGHRNTPDGKQTGACIHPDGPTSHQTEDPSHSLHSNVEAGKKKVFRGERCKSFLLVLTGNVEASGYSIMD